MSARQICLGSLAAAVMAVIAAPQAQAQSVAPFGFQAYGFYQPYGLTYRSSVATPPYFALNPPVYYGTRHYRPYGTSPFASPPASTAPHNYHATPGGPARRHGYQGPVSNPFICRSDARPASKGVAKANSKATTTFTSGRVRTNPFVDPAETDLISL